LEDYQQGDKKIPFRILSEHTGTELEGIEYEQLINWVQPKGDAFRVITGDFVHDPNSASQIAEFKRITAKINPKIPVYYTPGNHDLGQNPDETSLKKYKTNFGDDKFAFEHKGSSFIGFNSSLIKARMEKPEQDQYNWLVKKLKRSQKAQHIVLFCHYPFFNKTVDEPTAYSNIDQEFRGKYLDFFKDNKVNALFTGHYHNNKLLEYGPMQLVTTSALGKPLGEAPSGLRIVKIYPEKIDHQYYGLEELPDAVTY